MTVVAVAGPEIPAYPAVAEPVSIQPSHGPKLPSTVSTCDSIRPIADFGPPQKSTESQRFLPGVTYYGYRWLDPATGRWPSRDPIEEEGGINLYGFVGNDAINTFDVIGFFGGGEWAWNHRSEVPRAMIWYNGHPDFANIDTCGFDFDAEDHGSNSPLRNPAAHFQPLLESERQLNDAVKSCDPAKFQGSMHRAQDYFSHYSKGYRWNPGIGKISIPGGGWGHINNYIVPWLPNPDHDNHAWGKANKLTKNWLSKWLRSCSIQCCDKSKCEWGKKKSNNKCCPKVQAFGRSSIILGLYTKVP